MVGMSTQWMMTMSSAILIQGECRVICLDSVIELRFRGYGRNISVVVDMYLGFTKQVSNLASVCARHFRHQTMLILILISRFPCYSAPHYTLHSSVNSTARFQRKYSSCWRDYTCSTERQRHFLVPPSLATCCSQSRL